MKSIVEYVCKCGESFSADHNDNHFVAPYWCEYICDKCGKVMKLCVTKVITETRTEIVKQGDNENG